MLVALAGGIADLSDFDKTGSSVKNPPMGLNTNRRCGCFLSVGGFGCITGMDRGLVIGSDPIITTT